MKKHLLHLPVILICLLLLFLAVANARLAFGVLSGCVRFDGEGVHIAFDNVIDRITDKYKSDELLGKNAFINLNGLLMRLSGRYESNDVVRMKNGMLSKYEKPYPMGENAGRVCALSEALSERGIPFLFVQAPAKTNLAADLVRPYTYDASNDQADAFLEVLAEQGVAACDLRPVINADRAMTEANFYRTDHHWNTLGAFAGYGALMQELRQRFPGQYSVNHTKLSDWNVETIPKLSLGSWGKRTGVFFGGLDDIVRLTPRFETEMSCAVPSRSDLRAGDFEAACLREEYLRRDYFGVANYDLYFGGNYPWMKVFNPAAPNSMRVLILKDSFGVPLISFLATEFREIDAVDPRLFTDESLMECIALRKPDLVLMLMNPSTMTSDEFFTFGTVAFAEQKSKDSGERLLYFENKLELQSGDNNAHYLKIPVSLIDGCTYRLSAADIELRAGDTQGMSVALFSKSKNDFAVHEILDLKAERGEEGYAWSFVCPTGYPKGDLELRVYTGISGKTAGNELRLWNLRLREYYPKDGLYALYAENELELQRREDTEYWNVRLEPALTPGKSYRFRVDDLKLTTGVASCVTVGLYSNSSNRTLFTTAWLPSGAHVWQFTVPKTETDCHLQLFAGEAGKTGGVGLRAIRPVLEELSLPYGQELSFDALLETAAGGDYEYVKPSVKLQPGGTYTVRVGRIEATRGESSGLTVSLYDQSRKRHVARTNWFFNDGDRDFTWTFTLPADRQTAENCELLLYGGWAGETKGVAMRFENVSVCRMAEPVPDAVVYTEDRIRLDANFEAYHCASLPCLLLPGRSYELTIRNEKVLSGSPKALTVKLRSNQEKQDLMEKSWWLDGEPYAFRWAFTVPRGGMGEDALALQLFAGEQGKTKGVGVEYSSILLREISPDRVEEAYA